MQSLCSLYAVYAVYMQSIYSLYAIYTRSTTNLSARCLHTNDKQVMENSQICTQPHPVHTPSASALERAPHPSETISQQLKPSSLRQKSDGSPYSAFFDALVLNFIKANTNAYPLMAKITEIPASLQP